MVGGMRIKQIGDNDKKKLIPFVPAKSRFITLACLSYFTSLII